MSHLLAISVGPVQELIAAARRTRDLWFGSHLLSEVSRAVAKAVENHGGRLIFPASSDAEKAENVANVILAELNGGDPARAASEARDAARACWSAFAAQARREAGGVVRVETWDDQIDDVVEFYAAWVSYTGPGNYKQERARVMRLLAGRKNCRDFLPANGLAGVPKSSLDGQRETVLKGGDRTAWANALRLSQGEQLDVVGVTKRLGKRQGDSHPRYPSVARVAAEAWLRGVQTRGKLQGLKAACERLVDKGLNRVREENYQYFPFEGTVIYKDRHADLKRELRLGDRALEEVAAALGEIGREPNPYLAVLVADGDRMGDVISKRKSPNDHRDLSRALAGFASAARGIVNNHNGVLVYAGGDDVLAFAPVNKCLGCARELHDRFAEALEGFGSPTLSVGLAIGHFMESLEDLLAYGRTAERAAKLPDRDGLAVHLNKRGGSPIRVRAKWTDRLDDRLSDFAGMFNEEAIPARLPYELRKLADLYAGWRGEAAADAIRQDVLRVVARKRPGGGGSVRDRLGRYLDNLTSETLRRLAEELLVARQIAAALRQAGGRAEPVVEVAS